MAITGLPTTAFPPRFLAKRSYCTVSGKAPFSHLIYPVPVNGGLGMHVTLDLQGQARLGPNVEWVEREDYSVSSSIVPIFKKSSEGFWPGIRDRDISPAYAGLGPKIHGPETASADFYVQNCNTIGTTGLINLFGIESPGLTASLALARYVVG